MRLTKTTTVKMRTMTVGLLIFALFATFIGFQSEAQAAIAFDAASEGNTNPPKTNSLTISHTVGVGGTNRMNPRGRSQHFLKSYYYADRIDHDLCGTGHDLSRSQE
jgi:hypothetical protein